MTIRVSYPNNNALFFSTGSLAGNFTSEELYIVDIKDLAVQVAWTGNPTGTLKLQSSEDGTNFDDVADSDQALTGSAGSHTWSFPKCPHSRLRVAYTRVGGAGTIAGNFTTKV